MKIIFMGNPDFALPTLKLLCKSTGIDIVAVVSNPPKPIGRKRKLKQTAIGNYASINNLTLIEPASFFDNSLITTLESLNSDLFIVVAYRILPDQILAIPKYGSINLHASLLPNYRGAAPIQWVLMNGEKQTGVTTFYIDTKVDYGDILLKESVEILDEDNFQTLSKKLSEVGAETIFKTINKVRSLNSEPIKQNKGIFKKAPKISKDMFFINWNWNAEKIHNWIRGLSNMSFYWGEKRIKVYKTVFSKSNLINIPGRIYEKTNRSFIIESSDGLLSLKEIQQEGKSRMSIQDFMAGNYQYDENIII